jgi:hypothetical protein
MNGRVPTEAQGDVVSVVRRLIGTWLEAIAAAMLGVLALFSFAHEQYGLAAIASACAGLVVGVQIGVSVARRER